MEPRVLNDIYIINLEFWMFVNEIVIMEALIMESTVFDYIYFILEVWMFVNEIVILEALIMKPTVLDDIYFIDLEFCMCVIKLVIR